MDTSDRFRWELNSNVWHIDATFLYDVKNILHSETKAQHHCSSCDLSWFSCGPEANLDISPLPLEGHSNTSAEQGHKWKWICVVIKHKTPSYFRTPWALVTLPHLFLNVLQLPILLIKPSGWDLCLLQWHHFIPTSCPFNLLGSTYCMGKQHLERSPLITLQGLQQNGQSLLAGSDMGVGQRGHKSCITTHFV